MMKHQLRSLIETTNKTNLNDEIPNTFHADDDRNSYRRMFNQYRKFSE